MLFWVFTGDGDVILTLIFAYDFTLNTETCIKFLGEQELAWIEPMLAGKSFIRQHESAPWHIN